MREIEVRVWPREAPPREAELAGAIAGVAADPAPLDPEVAERVAERVIDAAAVAVAALGRRPVANARAQALAHPRRAGATVIGLGPGHTFEAGWAAWANAAAVRDLDYNDSFFGADTAHPSDGIAPVLAACQVAGRDGAALARGIATAYEIQIALAKSIPLIPHGIDQSTHLAPAMAAGVGAALGLDRETIRQAVSQAAHCGLTTRQARRGRITSWKACVPAFSGKLALEAIDRAMRGEESPAPVWEGPEGLIAVALGGPEARYRVPLPEPGEPRRNILESYSKAHPAGYASQAFIDLAFRLRARIPDPDRIERVEIHTCAHHHLAHGSGAGDAARYDPAAPRETLDHSVMYLFTVALQDGELHHERSYAPERAARPDTVRLWRATRTVLDPEWDRAYERAPDFLHKAQGGRVEITFADGSRLAESVEMPDAHPLGPRPFGMAEAVEKLRRLAEGVVPETEQARFLGLARRLPELDAADVRALTVAARPDALAPAEPLRPGLLDAGG